MADHKELPPLTAAETLGRRVFDKDKAARAARKGHIVPRIFRERTGVLSISTDRLDHAPAEEMARLGDEDAQARGRSQFYGWATLTVEDAAQDGRTVEAAPLLENRYHAEISLNIEGSDDLDDLQDQHAFALATAASWRPRP